MTRQILLGISSQIFLPVVLSRIAEEMDESRSEIWIRRRVVDYFLTHQSQFSSTIERGYSALKKKLEDNNGKTLSGKQIIYLVKKIGIPYLLVERKLKNKDLFYDHTAYEEELAN